MVLLLINKIANSIDIITDSIVLFFWFIFSFPFKLFFQFFCSLNSCYAAAIRTLISKAFLTVHHQIVDNHVFGFFLNWQFLIFFPVTVLSFIFNELEAMDCFEAVMQNAARFLKHLCITTCGIFISSLHFYVFYSFWTADWHSVSTFISAITSDSELLGIIRLIGSHKIATGIYLTRENKIAEVLEAHDDDNLYMRVFIQILNFILRKLNVIDETRKYVYRPLIFETAGLKNLTDLNYSLLASCIFVFFSECVSRLVPWWCALIFRAPMYGYFLFASFLFPTRLVVGLVGLSWSMLGLSSYFLVALYMLFQIYPSAMT